MKTINKLQKINITRRKVQKKGINEFKIFGLFAALIGSGTKEKIHLFVFTFFSVTESKSK